MQEERHEHQTALNVLPHRPKLGSEKTQKAKHEWDIDALTKAISQAKLKVKKLQAEEGHLKLAVK